MQRFNHVSDFIKERSNIGRDRQFLNSNFSSFSSRDNEVLFVVHVVLIVESKSNRTNWVILPPFIGSQHRIILFQFTLRRARRNLVWVWVARMSTTTMASAGLTSDNGTWVSTNCLYLDQVVRLLLFVTIPSSFILYSILFYSFYDGKNYFLFWNERNEWERCLFVWCILVFVRIVYHSLRWMRKSWPEHCNRSIFEHTVARAWYRLREGKGDGVIITALHYITFPIRFRSAGAWKIKWFDLITLISDVMSSRSALFRGRTRRMEWTRRWKLDPPIILHLLYPGQRINYLKSTL